jgi:hypothetical protein
MIAAEVVRMPRSLAKGRAYLYSMSLATLFPERIVELVPALRKLKQPRRIRERDRLRTLKVFAGRVCIAASTSVELSWESSRRMEQFHDRNPPDLAKQAARDLFGEALAAIAFPGTMSVLRLRSILHRPGLVAIPGPASCLDANLWLQESAPRPLELPIENKKTGLQWDFYNPSSARTPSRRTFFAPTSSERETKRECRFDSTSAEL